MEQPGKKLPKFEAFDNRRKFPRLKKTLPITISGSNGEKFNGIIHDISPDGIQVRFAVSDGSRLFPDKQKAVEDVKSLKCTLQFDLAYRQSVEHVRIDAYPVYLRPVSKNILAAGMFFSDEKLSENKKISDYLFYQLRDSYTDKEYSEKEHKETGNEPEMNIQRTVIEDKKQSTETEDEKIIPDELAELILQVEYPRKNLELFKQLLYRVLTSLKVIQETTRHIDERIHLIEHKLSRKG